MTEVFEQNKKLIEKDLRERAVDQNVILTKMEWMSDNPSKYTLRVSAVGVGWSEEKVLSQKEIEEYQTKMKASVIMKLESIIIELKKK